MQYRSAVLFGVSGCASRLAPGSPWPDRVCRTGRAGGAPLPSSGGGPTDAGTGQLAVAGPPGWLRPHDQIARRCVAQAPPLLTSGPPALS